jgi:NAD(P)-dependent dehydrogenase (short-subunit alcohol dehydrogenase family)
MTDQTKPVAIVTGAAGGMGSAAAIRLAMAGHDLILCDMDVARLETFAGVLRVAGAHAEVLAGNIAHADFPGELIRVLGERAISAVVHSAGLSPTRGDAATVFAVNYDASIRLLRVVQPRMAAGACAVLIASSAGYSAARPEIDAAIDALGMSDDSGPLHAIAGDNSGYAYSVSKRGVHRMVEKQAALFGTRGARIMSISPGLIDTQMGRDEKKAHPIMDEMRKATPLQREGTADEIAAVAAFLCSAGASFVTGSDVKVDGGVIAAMGG